MKRNLFIGVLAVAGMSAMAPAGAGEVTVVDARATAQSDGRYRFAVTLRHADAGWDHYANQWQVIGPDGKVLGTRTLFHPHVDEQPFTRSLGNVSIPAGVKSVSVRARDSVHGVAKKSFTVTLPGR